MSEGLFLIKKSVEVVSGDFPLSFRIVSKASRTSLAVVIAERQYGLRDVEECSSFQLTMAVRKEFQKKENEASCVKLQIAKREKNIIADIEPLILLLDIAAVKGTDSQPKIVSLEIDTLWNKEKMSYGLELKREADYLVCEFQKTLRLDGTFFLNSDRPMILKLVDDPTRNNKLIGFATIGMKNVVRAFFPNGEFSKELYFSMRELVLIDTGLFELKDVKGVTKGYVSLNISCGRPDLLTSSVRQDTFTLQRSNAKSQNSLVKGRTLPATD